MAEISGSARRPPRQYKSTIRCSVCGTESVRRSHNQKFCAGCVETAYREDNRKNEEKKRRAAGIDPIGSVMNCSRCGAQCIRTNGSQKYCQDCSAIVCQQQIKASRKKYEANNPPRPRNSPKDIARRKKWASENKSKIRAKQEEWRDKNRQKVNADNRARNKVEKNRLVKRAWERRRQAENPKFRLNASMKANVRRGLVDGKGGRAWTKLTGYSLSDLVRHLERQFSPGMTWENFGAWHVDHRQPLSSFNFERSEDSDFKSAWCLTNLQPLWNKDNWSKGPKRTLLV